MATTAISAPALHVPIAWWLGAALLFCFLLGINLYHNRKHPKASFSTNLKQAILWVVIGLSLGIVMWLRFGRTAGLQYVSGLLIEDSLSVDNIFVWGVILAYLRIPEKYQHNILFWGVFGAIIFRSIFVSLGLEVINSFQPILIALGVILLFSAYKLLRSGDDGGFDPESSRIFKFVRRVLPFTDRIEGSKFFTIENGRRVATLLFFAICVIELTDILFAVDSIPAVLAIARDPFVVITSNVAAILGLRTIYFVFEDIKDRFWLINKGLSVVLVWVGITLIIEPEHIGRLAWFGVHVPTLLSLGVVASMLVLAIGMSLTIPAPKSSS